MKTKGMFALIQRAALLLLLSTPNLQLSTLFAQGTAFNYQGRLNDGPNAANGTYDLRFKLWDDATGGNAWGPAITNYDVGLTNGLFSLTLDFGNGIFTGGPRWMETGVRTNGVVVFTTLTPRQPILPVPYAIFAGSA